MIHAIGDLVDVGLHLVCYPVIYLVEKALPRMGPYHSSEEAFFPLQLIEDFSQGFGSGKISSCQGPAVVAQPRIGDGWSQVRPCLSPRFSKIGTELGPLSPPGITRRTNRAKINTIELASQEGVYR